MKFIKHPSGNSFVDLEHVISVNKVYSSGCVLKFQFNEGSAEWGFKNERTLDRYLVTIGLHLLEEITFCELLTLLEKKWKTNTTKLGTGRIGYA